MIYAAYEPINATTLVWDLTAWTKLLQPYQTGHRRELHMYVWSLAILDWAWEQTELRDDGKLEKRQNVCHSEGTHGQVRGNLRSEIWHCPNRTSRELQRQLHPRQTLTQTQFFFLLITLQLHLMQSCSFLCAFVLKMCRYSQNCVIKTLIKCSFSDFAVVALLKWLVSLSNNKVLILCAVLSNEQSKDWRRISLSPGKSFSLRSFSKASGPAVDTPCL